MNYELIAIFLTVVGQGLYIANKMGKFEEKLDNVEKKQDKHNDIITRTFVLEEQMRVSNHRIEDLEDNR
jgi:hypothetical protein